MNIKKTVWLYCNDISPDGRVGMATREPRKREYGYVVTADSYVDHFCKSQFKKLTGITIRKGQCKKAVITQSKTGFSLRLVKGG